MANIVILGAGLSGLSAAYHLEKKGFTDYLMVEKENEVGGLCRSVHQDGFTFDYTGHLIHANDPYFYSFIDQTFGIQNLNAITRNAYVYSQETYTRYPYQSNLYGLPEDTIINCITGFAHRTRSRKKITTFTQWVHHNFGAGFGTYFFFPFQQKIFAYDIRKISASWTGRFVPGTSLEQILRGTLRDTGQKAVGYNAHFFYPKTGGIVSWINAIAQKIKRPIATNFCVKTIDLTNKTIIFANGHIESYKMLINTLPLDVVLRCIKDTSSTRFNDAAHHLRCNSVVNFNLGIKQSTLSDKHWIYLPEKQFIPYRIGFAHNFCNQTVPQGCSSLYGEFSHLGKSQPWVKHKVTQSIEQIKKLVGIQDHDIITEKIIQIPHAYVIYDFWREKHIQKLLDSLKAHDIHCIGRYGAWKYSSMQEAVMEGKGIADSLVVIPARQVSQDRHEHQEILPYQKRVHQKEL